MASRGKVYDNRHEHPGGSVIFTHAGDDFTDVFNAFHPATALKDMDKFYIGELDTVEPKDPHLATRFEMISKSLLRRLIVTFVPAYCSGHVHRFSHLLCLEMHFKSYVA